MVVFWSIGLNPRAELANTMLANGIAHLRNSVNAITQSDRGCHDRWSGWIELMERHNLIRSMSKKGCSLDNSACEGFFGRNWKGVSIGDFMSRFDEYIYWYNEKRIKISLGGLSPLEYRLKNKENKSIA